MRLKHLSPVLLVAAVLLAVTDAAAITSPFDGRWKASITQADLQRAGASPTLVEELYGAWDARYENGRFEFRNHRTGGVARGRFSVRGNVARLVYATGIGLKPGQISNCTWSIFRKRLTFKPITGRPSLLCNAGVWTRAG
jgi:hypothetical protein